MNAFGRLSAYNIVYSIAMALACLISFWIVTHLLNTIVVRDDDLLGGMWAAVATAFVFRDTGRAQALVFPDTVRNARSVDAYFWRGSPDAPLVQRIGAWLFGLFFMVLGFSFLWIAPRLEAQFFENLLGLLFIVLGVKIFYNGCKRRKRTNSP